MISLKQIRDAKERLDGIIRQTPIAYAPILSQKFNSKVYLKKENLQLTGSFKIRGAFNKIAMLSHKQKKKGVVAASAGNHAQGVAFSSEYFGCSATIIMPESTPLTKVSGVKSYGAEVILYGTNYDDSFRYAEEFAKRKNKVFVHPFADDDVIAGQATIGLEIIKEIETVDMIVVPIGGGGLITGIASVVKAIKPNVKIIGVVASGANAMKHSIDKQKHINSKKVKTIADGIAVRDVTPKMYDYVNNLIDKIVEVDDNEIASAILFLLEKHKLVVEGAGATGTAAIMHNKIDIKDKNIALLLSGGNIDVTMLAQIIEKGLVETSRKMNLVVTLIDKPGSLKTLTNIFEELYANIVQIDYDRNSVSLDFGDANVTISLETKGVKHQNDIRQHLKKKKYRFVQL